MSDNLIRCVHENGKVCFLTKAATENRNFMKKYGIRVEHVNKVMPTKEELDKIPLEELNNEPFVIPASAFEEVTVTIPDVPAIEFIETPVPVSDAITYQIAEAVVKPTKPKAKPRAAKAKKPTKK